MTTNRPTLDRKHTRKTDSKRDDALDAGVRMTVDGTPHTVRMGDVTPALARELRRETGMGFTRFMDTIATEPDVDLVATFVWLARRINGEHVDLDDVGVTYHSLLDEGFDVELAESSEVDDSPEA